MPKQSVDAKHWQERLEYLLKKAETTFAKPDDPTFPEDLYAIPDVILQVLRNNDRKAKRPEPFWPCVETLNLKKPKLGLVEALKKLVSNATKIPAGPFVRLVNDYQNGDLKESDKPLLIELDSYIYRAEESLDGEEVSAEIRWRKLPEDLIRFVPLLKRTLSSTFRSRVGLCKPDATPVEQNSWAYLAFLDLIWQIHDWNKRYFDGLSGLSKLLKELHNEEFDEDFGRLVYSPGPTIKVFVEHRKREKNTLAKRKSRGANHAKAGGAKSRRFTLMKGTLIQKRPST